jgi:hypothetical protein
MNYLFTRDFPLPNSFFFILFLLTHINLQGVSLWHLYIWLQCILSSFLWIILDWLNLIVKSLFLRGQGAHGDFILWMFSFEICQLPLSLETNLLGIKFYGLLFFLIFKLLHNISLTGCQLISLVIYFWFFIIINRKVCVIYVFICICISACVCEIKRAGNFIS